METPIYHLDKVVKVRQEDMEDFDGPLDLILHLLSKNKIEIRDIQISQLLDQYLEWMNKRKKLDLEVASEFVTMASHLIYIKTRILLSIHDEEAMSEMELLIQSLEQRQRKEAYGKIQGAAQFLAARNEIGLGMFVKEQEPLQHDNTYRYRHDREDLLLALQAIEEREARLLPPPAENFKGIVGTEPYPVTVKAAEVLRSLISRGVSKFLSLFRLSRSRSEIVATFLAVLELCKLKSISIDAEDADGDMNVTYLRMPEETVAKE